MIGKVHIFWEGHKILQNLHLTFVLCSASQKYVKDFAKFCGYLRIYELYYRQPPRIWKSNKNSAPVLGGQRKEQKRLNQNYNEGSAYLKIWKYSIKLL